MLRVLAVAIATIVLASATARADREPYVTRLVDAIRAGLDARVQARAPKLVPPVPVKLAWKAVRLGSVDLGAPLVAVASGDLDGDGKGELYGVTTRDVVAIGLDRKAKELARVPFSGDRPAQTPRDFVGTAVVDGKTLVASVSSWANELRVSWQGKQLAGQPNEAAGRLVCPHERLTLFPGRNHFGDIANPLYNVRCRDDLVDPEGRPLRVRAALTGAKLVVTVETCAKPGACQPAKTYELEEYGVAFDLDDVDRDGKPDIILTGAGAPGDPDAVKVMTIGGDEKKGLFRRSFQGGVVGVAAVDGDGNGVAEVIAAVRLIGSTRVDLWRLD